MMSGVVLHAHLPWPESKFFDSMVWPASLRRQRLLFEPQGAREERHQCVQTYKGIAWTNTATHAVEPQLGRGRDRRGKGLVQDKLKG